MTKNFYFSGRKGVFTFGSALFLLFFFSFNFVSAVLPNDSGTAIDFDYASGENTYVNQTNSTTINNINQFDQVLNTTSNVTFNQLSFNLTNLASPSARPIITFDDYLTASMTDFAGITMKSGFYKGQNSYGNGTYGPIFYHMIGATAGNTIFGSQVQGDTGDRRFRIMADGTLNWGNGSSATDTNLYRNGSNILRTDDSLIIAGDMNATRIGPTTSDLIINKASPAILQINDTNKVGRFGQFFSGVEGMSVNAYFDGANWQRDQFGLTNGLNSALIDVNDATTPIRLRVASNGTNPITWLTALTVSNNGTVQIGGATPVNNNKLTVLSDTASVTSGTVKAMDFTMSAKASGSSSASYRAVYGQTSLGSNQNITGNLMGGNFDITNARAYKVSTAYGIKTLISSDASSANYGNAYAGYFEVQNNNAGATIDNGYGIYLPSFTKTGNITNSYGIYQAGTGEKNYYAGNVGIGTTAPTYKLHILESQSSTFPTNGITGYVKGTVNPNANATTGLYNAFEVDAYKSGSNNLTGTTKVVGLGMNADNIGSGTVQNMYGGRFGMYNEGTGTIVNSYTNYLLLSAGASNPITNAYGLYIDTHKQAGVTKAYGIYQAGVNDSNYFAGNTTFAGLVNASSYASGGAIGITASGTSCTITNITNGIITGATCI